MKPPDLARITSDDYHNDDDDDDDGFDMCLNDMIYRILNVCVVYLNAQSALVVGVFACTCVCVCICVCVCVCVWLTRAQLI